MMKFIFAAFLLALLAATPEMAGAATTDRCATPAHLLGLGQPLPRLAARLARHEAVVVVAIGSSSTGGAGASDPATAQATYFALDRVLDVLVLPPQASFSVAAILTGLVLAGGTRWGLFQHWWVVVKLGLSLAVLLTGLRFVDAWVQQASASPPAAEARGLLIYASSAHLLMLGAAILGLVASFAGWTP